MPALWNICQEKPQATSSARHVGYKRWSCKSWSHPCALKAGQLQGIIFAPSEFECFGLSLPWYSKLHFGMGMFVLYIFVFFLILSYLYILVDGVFLSWESLPNHHTETSINCKCLLNSSDLLLTSFLHFKLTHIPYLHSVMWWYLY